MKNQLVVMLEMQDAMNARVNPDWRNAGNAWYRAIWTECAEMLDHYGWKWWKHQQPDLEQVQLESRQRVSNAPKQNDRQSPAQSAGQSEKLTPAHQTSPPTVLSAVVPGRSP